MIKILSIDGGGVRGIIPAMVLAEIEKRAGRSIVELFDLIAGTSTGGLLALALVRPSQEGQPALNAAEVVQMYEQVSPAIFSRSNWQRLNAIGNLRKNKYHDQHLNEVLSTFFSEVPISQALTDVLITGYEIQRGEPWFFRSSKARQTYACEFLMKEVARATIAAPTFFSPATITQEELGFFHAFIDGAVVANSPALAAYVEARKTYPEEDDFLIVSLGTGEYSTTIAYEEAKDWGLIGWSQQIVNILFQTVSITVDYQLRRLLPEDKNGRLPYYRFQIKLGDANDAFDDVSPENLEKLKARATELIARDNMSLEELISRLLPSPAPAPQPSLKNRLAAIWKRLATTQSVGDAK